ncbi:hypothetical protein EZV62_007978 [Acer yangbiense]|uniref:Uncharacterized protein n=1 Tax=Acer yangbiense TaxID=1000413 RepID=A0A5C7IBF9_9ROSI|nr:hypothetical protein EZV62_007978 [Acer yangbiense]
MEKRGKGRGRGRPPKSKNGRYPSLFQPNKKLVLITTTTNKNNKNATTVSLNLPDLLFGTCCLSKWPKHDKKKRSYIRSLSSFSSNNNSSSDSAAAVAPPQSPTEEYNIPGPVPYLYAFLSEEKIFFDFWSIVLEIDD